MKKFIHISDLHFGREDKEIVGVLLDDIEAHKPDLVIVSGDLTQRARRKQFEAAAQFLRKIRFPKVVVPGNHDVPLYDVTRRFLAPFNRYIKYINADFYPSYIDDLLCVVGINTAYSFTWKSGRVTGLQLDALKEKFAQADYGIKILVVHHPFEEIFTSSYHHNTLKELDIDLILSGHLHKATANVCSSNIAKLDLKTLIVQAGTAVSTRLRGESNSYNLIEVKDRDALTITVNEYHQLLFKERSKCSFQKTDGKWQLIKPAILDSQEEKR